MDNVIRVMIDRLVEKGLEIDTIPAFIRDVANVFGSNPHLDLQELNSRLKLLGWFGFDLDDHTLQLILLNFEPGEINYLQSGNLSRHEATSRETKIVKTFN